MAYSRKAHAHGERHFRRATANSGQSLINAIDRRVRGRRVRNRNLADFPAKYARMNFLEGDTTVVDANDCRTLGTGLPEEPPLKVSREHDVRVRTENIAFVDMAKRPITVTLVRKGFDGARSVARVLR